MMERMGNHNISWTEKHQHNITGGTTVTKMKKQTAGKTNTKLKSRTDIKWGAKGSTRETWLVGKWKKSVLRFTRSWKSIDSVEAVVNTLFSGKSLLSSKQIFFSKFQNFLSAIPNPSSSLSILKNSSSPKGTQHLAGEDQGSGIAAVGRRSCHTELIRAAHSSPCSASNSASLHMWD